MLVSFRSLEFVSRPNSNFVVLLCTAIQPIGHVLVRVCEGLKNSANLIHATAQVIAHEYDTKPYA